MNTTTADQRNNRTLLFTGVESFEKLRNAHVLVVGLGGVGAYVAESLCRAGVGTLTLADGDTIDVSNLNRQLPSLLSTIGKAKAEILADRFRDINPDLTLHLVNYYLKDENIPELLDRNRYDYVVDAIDTLAPKVYLIAQSVWRGYRIVSSMGAGGKSDPTQIQIKDISKSHGCKLAKVTRQRLSKLGIKKGVKVVFSPEEVPEFRVRSEDLVNKKSVVGTISYMPATFGCFIASVVLRDLLELNYSI